MEHDEDFVKKWEHTGYLRDVKRHLVKRAAERLEFAFATSRGARNWDAMNAELAAMTREGYYDK